MNRRLGFGSALVIFITLFLVACGGGGSSSGGGEAPFANISGTWTGPVTFGANFTASLGLLETGQARVKLPTLKEASTISGSYSNTTTAFVADVAGSRDGNAVTLNLVNHVEVGDYEYQMALTLDSDTHMSGVTRITEVATGDVTLGTADLTKQ